VKANLQIRDEWATRTLPVIIGCKIKVGSWEFVWWGFSQLHKWRWHKSHIDLGALSVYGFRYNHWFWREIAFLIKPLRCKYHRRFKSDWLNKYEAQLGESSND